MASYNTSEFRKGLKVQLDGDPYLMIECNFVKPGKGQALYKCKLRNLLRNTVIDRTYKSGDSLEAAEIEEIQAQYLYRQMDQFVFMDNETYEQYELSAEQIDDSWKYLKEAMICSIILYNRQPISMTPPNHVVLRHQCDQTVQDGYGRRISMSRVCQHRRPGEDRYPHWRIHRTREGMTSDFLPTAGWEYLRLRAELLCRLRKFFFDRGFLEVETPILSADTVVDRHLDPFSLEISLPGQSAKRFWLQTSPELAMKRLLAAGAKAIYQVSRVFRQDEIGPLHNPEFTLVEWYKVGHEMNEGMQLTGEFAGNGGMIA
ncbi:MAG: amino acid--tRNA ligase-related protein, partial [Thermoguttaceae bacterium]